MYVQKRNCYFAFDLKRKTSVSEKKPIGVRLSKNVRQLLDEASKAAGVSRTEVIEECVSRYDAQYVRENLEDRQKAFEDFSNTDSDSKQ